MNCAIQPTVPCRVNLGHRARQALLACLCAYGYLSAGCSKPDPLQVEQEMRKQGMERLRGCLPATTNQSEPVQLTLAAIARTPDETSVRLIASSQTEAEFHLPIYLMSRGRWLIEEKARVYLLDERCQEYKLKDRAPVEATPLPLDGKVKLTAHQAFAFRLSFPRLHESVQGGALVYGPRIIPFSLLVEGK